MEREERPRHRTVVCLCSPFADKSSCSLNGWVCECVLRRSAAYNTNRTAHYASESLNISHSVCVCGSVCTMYLSLMMPDAMETAHAIPKKACILYTVH